MKSYIVIVETDHLDRASIGKLNYNSTQYEVVASGKFQAIKSLVDALNKNGTTTDGSGDTCTAAAPSDAFDPVTVANRIAKTMRHGVWP